MVKRKNYRKSKKNATKVQWVKGLVIGGGLAVLAGVIALVVTLVVNNQPADYIVETNAFFAPFEFYAGREIKGVDIEIIQRVAERMGKKIEVKDVEFDVIIDNVAAGKIADAGAAGLTVTPARAEKVNFSVPYYNSVQYIIYSKAEGIESRGGHVLWNALAGKTLGSQTGGTGYLFASDEIDEGVLKDTETKIKGFDSHQLAADAIGAHIIDYAIADELAAKFIVGKNDNLAAMPLYYAGETEVDDYPVEEAYAIAVNKERTELLLAFNEVLGEMLTKNAEGVSEIDRLILKYMGLL